MGEYVIMDVRDLKDLIAAKLDVAEFLDIIGYTMYELVDALEAEVAEYSEELERACE
jgi:hypothetical protein